MTKLHALLAAALLPLLNAAAPARTSHGEARDCDTTVIEHASIRRHQQETLVGWWRDQDPNVTVPFSGGGTPAYLEIDKLANGRYRATVGTLFEFQELCRTGDLEGLLRHTRAVQTSGSFDEMVQAIRAMYALGDLGH